MHQTYWRQFTAIVSFANDFLLILRCDHHAYGGMWNDIRKDVDLPLMLLIVVLSYFVVEREFVAVNVDVRLLSGGYPHVITYVDRDISLSSYVDFKEIMRMAVDKEIILFGR